MSLQIKEIVFLLVYAIGINALLVGFANLGADVSCPNIYDTIYDTQYNATEINVGVSSNPVSLINTVVTITNLVTNRCQGIPYILVLIFELPIIVGLLYIVRGFIGAT